VQDGGVVDPFNVTRLQCVAEVELGVLSQNKDGPDSLLLYNEIEFSPPQSPILVPTSTPSYSCSFVHLEGRKLEPLSLDGVVEQILKPTFRSILMSHPFMG
jgi:hypothetical protein